MFFQEPLLFIRRVFNTLQGGLRIRGIGKKEMYWGSYGTTWERFWNHTRLADRSARTFPAEKKAQRTSLWPGPLPLKPCRSFCLERAVCITRSASRESLVEDLQRVLKETGDNGDPGHP